jgi:hypothetical protein
MTVEIGASAPSRASRRHLNSKLECTPCARATDDTVAPGRASSPTIRSFSAALHRRRAATPVITSTRS